MEIGTLLGCHAITVARRGSGASCRDAAATVGVEAFAEGGVEETALSHTVLATTATGTANALTFGVGSGLITHGDVLADCALTTSSFA